MHRDVLCGGKTDNHSAGIGSVLLLLFCKELLLCFRIFFSTEKELGQ